MPTGAGKTVCIDIALFCLALSVEDTAGWCARRIVMVVDRRVVVDQAARHAHRVARALTRPPSNSVTAEVADRLKSLSSESIPLRVATLRGGIPRDHGWARTPDQPLVIASTVDQLGSRLLFRGYGISASMRPIHAGLLGNDCLVLLDEVHLSQPFKQTLTAVSELRETGHCGSALQVVALSATPGREEKGTFRLTDVQRNEKRLAVRLEASKPATLQICNGREALASEAVRRTVAFLDQGHRSVAVVVNRVDSAHSITRKLQEKLGSQPRADVRLMTGRMRPVDRDDRVRELEPRVAAIKGRRKDNPDARPAIAVATQCIEAGADFDFDALVTEHASLDALRQRFGRLDRLGEYGRAQAALIGVQEFDQEKNKWEIPKDDPIYGEALALTWKELKKHANASKRSRGRKQEVSNETAEPTIDFGVNELAKTLELTDLGPLLAPKSRAPVMFPVYLDLWAQTNPGPLVEPYVPLFLHGPQAGPADLQIAWRVDLDDGECWESEEDERPSAIDRVVALPPSSLEVVGIPFRIGERWLRGQTPRIEILADVDRPLVLDENDTGERLEGIDRAIVWRGDRSFILDATTVKDLLPSDTIVVPASRGGLFMGSFDASEIEPVSDIAERASFEGRAKALLRLHPSVLTGLGLTMTDKRVELSRNGHPQWLIRLVEMLKDAATIHVDDSLELLRGRRCVSPSIDMPLAVESQDEEATDPDTSSFRGRAVTLSRHSLDVERWARHFCERLGLTKSAKPVGEAIIFAGWLHDVGKADPRFQRLLRGGSEITLLKDQRRKPSDWLLAKSDVDESDVRRRREAAKCSGYPPKARHEMLSLAMVQNNAEVRAEAGKRGLDGLYFDLTLHLVSSHHGWCRPYPPAVVEPDKTSHVSCKHGVFNLSAKVDHSLHKLDSGIAERFVRLNEHFGPLQLAWLEAILRLADHRASEEEADDGSA